MKESKFNIKFKVDDEIYIFNSRNNGIIQIDKDNSFINGENKGFFRLMICSLYIFAGFFLKTN